MAALQTSFEWLIPPAVGLRFPDRPALVELANFYKNRCEIPLTSGTLECDLRF
jgi:hypothetical protein